MCLKLVRRIINSSFIMRRCRMANKYVICVAIIAIGVAGVYLVANYSFSHVKDHLSKTVAKMYQGSLFNDKSKDRDFIDKNEMYGRDRLYNDRENDAGFKSDTQNKNWGNPDSRIADYRDRELFRRWKKWRYYKDRYNRYNDENGETPKYINDQYRGRLYNKYGDSHIGAGRSDGRIPNIDDDTYKFRDRPGNVDVDGYGNRRHYGDMPNRYDETERINVPGQPEIDLAARQKLPTQRNKEPDSADQDFDKERNDNKNGMYRTPTPLKRVGASGTETTPVTIPIDEYSYTVEYESKQIQDSNSELTDTNNRNTNDNYKIQNEKNILTQSTESERENNDNTQHDREMVLQPPNQGESRNDLKSENVNLALGALAKAQQVPQYITDHHDKLNTSPDKNENKHDSDIRNGINQEVRNEHMSGQNVINQEVQQKPFTNNIEIFPNLKEEHVVSHNGINPDIQQDHLNDGNINNNNVKEDNHQVIDNDGLNPIVKQKLVTDNNGLNSNLLQKHNAMLGKSLNLNIVKVEDRQSETSKNNLTSKDDEYKKMIAGLSHDEILKRIQDANDDAHPFIKNDHRKYATEHKIEIFDWTKPIQDSLFCQSLTTRRGKPKICLLDPLIDPLASKSLFKKDFYEQGLLNEIELALSRDPGINLIDIGANVGVYTITALQYGRHVLAVEPDYKFIPYLHKSVVINNFQNRTTLLLNAISYTKQTVQLKMINDVQRIVPVEEFPPIKHVKIPSITLDEIVPLTKFEKAILKIDIPTPVSRALLISTEFFNRLTIPYIFMNWDYIKDDDQAGMVEGFLRKYKYQAKKTIDGKSLPFDHETWEGEIVFVKN